MDIAKRLILLAAKEPRNEWAPIALEASSHIESLKEEIRIQRAEIAALREERKSLFESERPRIDLDYWER